MANVLKDGTKLAKVQIRQELVDGLKILKKKTKQSISGQVEMLIENQLKKEKILN
jgi:hypothetical protein